MCLLKNYFKEKKARKEVLGFDDEKIDSIIKIEGTDFDRKRKYSSMTVASMKSDYENGMSISAIATKYGAGYTTVKYNVVPNFKEQFNAKRSGKHTGVDVCTFLNRVEYKRYLVKSKKIKVAGII